MAAFRLLVVSAAFLFGAFGQDLDSNRLILTPYEMFTTVELLTEIVVRPCKEINRPLMSKIKNFIYNAIQDVPKQKDTHTHGKFMESYVNLVNCLSFVDATYEKTPKALASSYASKRDEENSKGRFRRETDNDYDNMVASRRFSLEQEVDMADYDKSFDTFFYHMFSITQKVCPLTRENFSMNFILPVLEQTADWIAKDRKMQKSALRKFFHNGNLMEDLKFCDAMVNIEGKIEDYDEEMTGTDGNKQVDSPPGWNYNVNYDDAKL